MKYLSLIVFALFTNLIIGQSLSVIHMTGESYTVKTVDGKEKYNKIVFGPIGLAEKLIVKEGATVRLMNDEKQVLDLNQEGSYLVQDLKFTPVEENSIFSKFCDYFHSFFVNHSSAESKANYRNSIYAISRGNVPPPYLDFPLNGSVPYSDSVFPFIWTHACEDCEYIITVYDYETRSPVYASTTNENRVEVSDVKSYFKPNTKYYWTVTISGEEMEYKTNIFTTAVKQEYEKTLAGITSDLSSSDFKATPTTETIYVISELQERGLTNFAVYYGLQQLNKYPDNLQLKDFVERFWYDTLVE